MKRTPLKRSTTPLKRTPIKRKPVDPEKKKVREEQHDLDRTFYMGIWESRPHYCELCNTGLWGEIRSYFFHHILPKGSDRYKHLRYEDKNILFVCFSCHQQIETCPSNLPIKNYEKLLSIIQKIKILFNV